MKEAVKRVTSWAAYYHTSGRSWYPKPEGSLQLSQVPIMKPLPSVSMSSADCNALRDWASSYGAAVRQRTVRQETTMAKHGTLPEFMYQRCQRKIIRKKTRVTPSLMKAAMKMLKIMVGKNRFFKERSEARPRFSWERRLDLGELLDLTIVCSTDHRNAVAGS